MKKFLKTLWSIVWPLAVYLLLAVIIEIIHSLILVFKNYYATGELNIDSIIYQAINESLGSTAIVSAISILIFIFVIRGDRKRHAGDPEIEHADITFPAIIAAIGGCLVGNYVLAVSGIMEADEAFDLVNEVIMSASVWMQILTAVILAPICEELLFRGIIYKRVEYSYGFWPAAIVSSLIFGAMHGNISQFIYASALGMLFAFAYRKSGKLWVCILMHLIANAASLVFESFSMLFEDYAVVETIQIVVGAVLLIAGLIMMIKRSPKPKNR